MHNPALHDMRPAGTKKEPPKVKPQLDIFSGEVPEPTYDRTLPDDARRKRAIVRVMELMLRGEWVTLRELRNISESADRRLRDLRDPAFGGFHVHVIADDRGRGMYRYKLAKPTEEQWAKFLEATAPRGGSHAAK